MPSAACLIFLLGMTRPQSVHPVDTFPGTLRQGRRTSLRKPVPPALTPAKRGRVFSRFFSGNRPGPDFSTAVHSALTVLNFFPTGSFGARAAENSLLHSVHSPYCYCCIILTTATVRSPRPKEETMQVIFSARISTTAWAWSATPGPAARFSGGVFLKPARKGCGSPAPDLSDITSHRAGPLRRMARRFFGQAHGGLDALPFGGG